MPRLKSSVTGVVVNVDDDTASRLGSEWQAAEDKPKPRKTATKKPSESDN